MNHLKVIYQHYLILQRGKNMMRKLKIFTYSTLIVLICAYITRYFTMEGIEGWFVLSRKPAFMPPESWFAPIWSVLYALMILSFYLVLRYSYKPEAAEANSYFLTQLLLQVIWSFTFFFKGYIALALVVILYLDYVVFRMLGLFKSIRPLAAYLLYPFFIWLIFATILNFSFILTNGMVVFE